MTYKEYQEKMKNLRYEERYTEEECLSSLNEKYKDFIGKKVMVKGKWGVAYFNGFGRTCFSNIEPIFNKVKKDGTQAKVSCGWCYFGMDYDNIEMRIVNE